MRTEIEHKSVTKTFIRGCVFIYSCFSRQVSSQIELKLISFQKKSFWQSMINGHTSQCKRSSYGLDLTLVLSLIMYFQLPICM